MKKFLALGAALLAVSGCNSSEGGNEAGKAGNSSAGAAGANETIDPGLWEITMQMAMNVPGMQEGMNRPAETRRECITPEETREMAQTFAEQPQDMECSERQFTMRGGRMEGRMTCRGTGEGPNQGQELRIRMNGDYSRTSFNFRQEMTGQMPGTTQPMSMQVQAQGRRVADQCPPESEEGSGNSSRR